MVDTGGGGGGGRGNLLGVIPQTMENCTYMYTGGVVIHDQCLFFQIQQVFNERDILTVAQNPFVVGLWCTFQTKVLLKGGGTDWRGRERKGMGDSEKAYACKSGV